MLEKYYLFYLLAFVAEVLGTVSGFGSSVLFVPLATYFFDFQTVLGLTALFHVFSNVSKILLFRKGVDKHIALYLGVPAVIAVVLGAFISKFIPQDELEFALHIFLLLLALFLLYTQQQKPNASNTNLIVGGTISGYIAGLVGTGGAVRGITLAAFQIEKEVFIATSALIDFGVDLSRAVVYFFNGFFQDYFIQIVPYLLAISIAGSWAGKRILAHIPDCVFQKVVLVVILGISVVQIGTYLWKRLA